MILVDPDTPQFLEDLSGHFSRMNPEHALDETMSQIVRLMPLEWLPELLSRVLEKIPLGKMVDELAALISTRLTIAKADD